ncbi:MAG: ATP-binding protein [Proteobacteria bacterium]|nr:ATP-binding protein [Pseudomonadota bacterium]
MRHLPIRWLPDLLFVAVFLLFDWVSYVHALYGLNITPWNPDPALGLAYWMRYGRRAALPWFVANMLAEILVRDLLAGWLITVVSSAVVTLGYGLIGEVLRHRFRDGSTFDNRSTLFAWLSVVVVGSVLNSLVYISVLYLAGMIPQGQWSVALLRFGIGDIVGIVGSMPLLWMLLSDPSRARLQSIVPHLETGGYVALAILMLGLVFGHLANVEFMHFYFLFLPIVWAATRQGLRGAALIAFVLQFGIIIIVKWLPVANIPVVELQMLGAVLALVGFFIGVVVDEQRQAAEDLKITLRLAAAGEMASALAHELNQPITALVAYGKACKELLERGEAGEVLKGAIEKMINESGRASDVVRRLRDFFRSGAMQLEVIEVDVLVAAVVQQFAAKFQEQGVELQLAPASPASLRADRLQIELVLRNLLANALDEVVKRQPGNRLITLTSERLSGEKLRISVEDSGLGISSKTAAHLFEPFASTKSSGLGLGLFLSRAIVEAHGGSLWAEVGSHGIFRLVLPSAELGESVEV